MIPKWNISGVIPPVLPSEQGHSLKRSPYKVGLSELIETFSYTPERKVILKGLLDYRDALYKADILLGFQWLDGSFLENIEVQEARPPNDIDVVTFFNLPDGVDQRTMFNNHGSLFDPAKTKPQFHVDAYPFVLGEDTKAYHIKMISYWYSMWSHRRDGVWKGFIQVDLSESDDKQSRKLLEQM